MNKYILYRNPVKEDAEGQSELIAVEVGYSPDDVLDELMEDIMNDMEESPEYRGCTISVLPPEDERTDGDTGNKIYTMTGIAEPPAAPKNLIVEYTVIEKAET